jgi:hypothetical protein
MRLHMVLYLPIEEDKALNQQLTIGPASFEVSDQLEIHFAILGFLVLSNKMEYSEGAEKFAKGLKVYDRFRELFLDTKGTLLDQGVSEGSLLIATTCQDKKLLNEFIRVRQATKLEILAKEIRNGE